MPQTIIGCDLSKDHLDVYDLEARHGFQVANTTEAIAAFVATLPEETLVVFEATSGCDDALIVELAARERAYARVNPRRAREFARASGVLAKTDRVDARMLAVMGRRLELTPTRPPEPLRQRLAALLLRRRQLVAQRQAEGVRLRLARDRDVIADGRSMLRLLDRRIEHFNTLIAQTIQADGDLAAAARRLRAVPGVGPIATATLLSALPELGQLDRRRIAALAGLAPLARDSGQSRGRRRLWGGRRTVRQALYIAALSAARLVPTLKDMRERLRAKGKSAKTILIAIARRLLTILNAIVRDSTPFQPTR